MRRLRSLRVPEQFMWVMPALFLSLFLFLAHHPFAAAFWNTFHDDAWASVFSGRDAGLELAMGDYFFSSAHYDISRAQFHYERAAEANDELSLVHYELARIYFIKGDTVHALREIDKQIAYFPDYDRNYYIKGLIEGYAKEYDAAIEDFHKFIARQPRSWAGYNDLAWVYFAKGDFVDAAQTAKDGLAVDSSNPWLLNSLGVSLMNTGDKEGAKVALEKAERLVRLQTPDTWGRAYPGNDPVSYGDGLTAMRASISDNLALLEGNPHSASD